MVLEAGNKTTLHRYRSLCKSLDIKLMFLGTLGRIIGNIISKIVIKYLLTCAKS